MTSSYQCEMNLLLEHIARGKRCHCSQTGYAVLKVITPGTIIQLVQHHCQPESPWPQQEQAFQDLWRTVQVSKASLYADQNSQTIFRNSQYLQSKCPVAIGGLKQLCLSRKQMDLKSSHQYQQTPTSQSDNRCFFQPASPVEYKKFEGWNAFLLPSMSSGPSTNVSWF